MSLAIERSRDQGDFRHIEADSTDLRPPRRMIASVRHLVHFLFTNWRCGPSSISGWTMNERHTSRGSNRLAAATRAR